MAMRPRVRARVFQVTLYVVFVVAVVLVVLFVNWGKVQDNFLDVGEARKMFPDIVIVAAKNTVLYTAVAFIGGLILGLILALMKLSPAAPYRWLATTYIEFFRGLPALLVIFAFAFAVPLAFAWHPPGGTVALGIMALIVVSGAYIAETIRAGIQAVPKGQTEAARSLGMSPVWTMASVILPQAIRIVIPPLTNQLVTIIKDTALLFVVGFALEDKELTTFARNMVSQDSNATPLVVAALMYLVVTLPLTQLVAHLERRTQKAR